jgi:hypothetical protein
MLVLSFILASPYALADGFADTSCKDRDVATVHFKRGNELYKQKNLDGALAAFRTSRELCPSENNTLNMALLLKELDRPLEALEMLDVLEHEFPALLPENAETVKVLRATLLPRIGSVIFDGDYPGARILVDGKDVGTMPQARPIKLPIGKHTARIEMEGYQPLDTTFIVLPKGNVQIAVALAPTPIKREEPRKEQPAALHSFHVGIGLSLSPSLGGKVTDCDSGCGAAPGVGWPIVAGYRYRALPALHVGATAGYFFLWQARSKTGASLSLNGKEQFADVKDSLFMNAFLAGPEISTSFHIGRDFFNLGFALGPIGGPLVNVRKAEKGRSAVDDPPTFDLSPPPRAPISGFGGLFLMLQASWRTHASLAPGWPLHLTIGVLGFAPVNGPEYNASFTADFKDPLAQNRPATYSERLIGSWEFVFTPGITVYHGL